MLRNNNKITVLLIILLVLNVCGGAYYFIQHTHLKDESFDTPPICLFVDNVRSGFWQSILYATYQFSQKNQHPLISFDFFQQKGTPNIDVCLNNSAHSIYGWQKQSDILVQLKEHNIDVSYAYQLYPTLEVAHVIKQFLEQKNHQEKVRVALLLGSESFSGHQELNIQLKRLIDPNKGEVVFTSFSPDLIAYQSFALSDLLLKHKNVDYIIATDTAALLTSRHIKNNNNISSKLISLSLSKQSLSAINAGTIEAAVDLKLIKNTRLYLSEYYQSQYGKRYAGSPEVNMVTRQNIQQVRSTDSFVPYGYNVFYNNLYIKND